jgi:hypothetical protein
VIGRNTYLAGSATLLHAFSHVPTAVGENVAGRWIRLRRGDGPYQVTTQQVTIESVFSGALLHAREKVAGTEVRDGQPAIRLTGIQGRGANSSPATLWVGLAAPHLPIAVTSSLTSRGATISSADEFGGWGQPVRIAPPSHSLSWRQALATAA